MNSSRDGARTLSAIARKKIIPNPLPSFFLSVIALFFFFLGCQTKENIVPVHGVLPDFHLQDQAGKAFTKNNLRDSVWVADFIFSRCSGQCPAMNTLLSGLQSDLAAWKDVRYVSFTVDPAFDTPETLAKYAEKLHADPSRWVFVTGPKEDVYRLCKEGFKLGVGENTSDVAHYAEEPIFHSSRFVLVDSNGRVRGYYDAYDPQALGKLKADIAAVREEKTP